MPPLREVRCQYEGRRGRAHRRLAQVAPQGPPGSGAFSASQAVRARQRNAGPTPEVPGGAPAPAVAWTRTAARATGNDAAAARACRAHGTRRSDAGSGPYRNRSTDRRCLRLCPQRCKSSAGPARRLRVSSGPGSSARASVCWTAVRSQQARRHRCGGSRSISRQARAGPSRQRSTASGGPGQEGRATSRFGHGSASASSTVRAGPSGVRRSGRQRQAWCTSVRAWPKSRGARRGTSHPRRRCAGQRI